MSVLNSRIDRNWMWQLRFKYSEIISVDACKEFIHSPALRQLGHAFPFNGNNQQVIREFISAKLFRANDVQNLLSSSHRTNEEWVTEFLDRIYRSPHILACLNLLCNLENENYRTNIHNIFNLLPDVEVIENVTNQGTENECDSGELDSVIALQPVYQSDNALLENYPPQDRPSESRFFGKKKKLSRNMGMLLKFVGVGLMLIIIISAVVKASTDQPKEPGEKTGGVNFTSNATLENSHTSEPPSSTPLVTNSSKSGLAANNASLEARPFDPTIVNVSSPKNSSSIALSRPDNGLVAEKQLNGTITVSRTLADPGQSVRVPAREHSAYSIQQVYAKRPRDLHGQAAIQKLCNPDFNTILVLDVIDPYEWENVVVDCGTRVNQLKITGHASIRIIHKVLTQTTNIANLTISGSAVCERNSGQLGVIETLSEITLGHVRGLKFDGFTDSSSNCREILAFLASKVSFPKLKYVFLHNVLMTRKNKPEINRIIYNARATLHEFHGNGLELQTAVFDLNFPSLKLSKFHFYVTNSSCQLANQSLLTFLGKAQAVSEFHTNVEVGDNDMGPVLTNLGRLKVKDLDVIVVLGGERDKLSLKFLGKLRKLTHCELRLRFLPDSESSKGRLVVRDFNRLRRSLVKFQITADFKFKDLGANDVPCRSYDKYKNSSGHYTLTSDTCLNCSRNGCMRRR